MTCLGLGYLFYFRAFSGLPKTAHILPRTSQDCPRHPSTTQDCPRHLNAFLGSKISFKKKAGQPSQIFHVKMDSISFNEISAGASARVTVINGQKYQSVHDTIMHTCGLVRKRAIETWHRYPEEYKERLADEVSLFQFPGQGNKPTPVITFKGVLKLLMMLSGKKAALNRLKMTSILTRYYAGDGTLPNKRKLEELEIAKQETEIESRRAETKAMQVETSAKQVENCVKCITSYQDICKDTVTDARAKQIFKGLILDAAMPEGESRRVIVVNEPAAKHAVNVPGQAIKLSQVAGSLGLKLSIPELKALGSEVSKLYVAKHGKRPGKHEQLCQDGVKMVNTYTEEDRPLVEQVLLRWRAEGRV